MRNVERLHDFVTPAPLRNVEEQRPRGVRGVDSVLAAHPEADIVLRQQNAMDARVGVRFVLPEPEQLGSGEAGQCPVSGQLDQPLEPDSLLDLRALGSRPLIVPEHRGTQHLILVVEADEAVHLPGEPNGRGRGAQRVERRPAGPQPVVGILLCPTGLGYREGVALLGGSDHLSVGRDSHCLDPSCANVQPYQCRLASHGGAPRRPRAVALDGLPQGVEAGRRLRLLRGTRKLSC